MVDLHEELQTQYDEETAYQTEEIARANERMTALEELLSKERADRIESLDTQLEPIN